MILIFMFTQSIYSQCSTYGETSFLSLSDNESVIWESTEKSKQPQSSRESITHWTSDAVLGVEEFLVRMIDDCVSE